MIHLPMLFAAARWPCAFFLAVLGRDRQIPQPCHWHGNCSGEAISCAVAYHVRTLFGGVTNQALSKSGIPSIFGNSRSFPRF